VRGAADALRVTWALAVDALAAPIAREIALMTLAALGLSGDPFHEPFHARRRCVRLSWCRESIDSRQLSGSGAADPERAVPGTGYKTGSLP